jgi:hypothetical protein
MDTTIAYLKDPEMSEMVSVVSKHTRFTVDSAMALARAQAKKYDDDNDRDNNTAATECLLDSVSPDLKKRMRNRIADMDPFFPKVWIEFVALLVLSTSIDRYEKLKQQRIQGRHPSQYAGQNMVKLVEVFSTDAKALTMAGHYDHSLMLSIMLQIFLKAGGDRSAGEAFRLPIRTLKMRLDAALLAIELKEKGPAQAFMAKEELLFTDICKCVENEYRKLKQGCNGMDSGQTCPRLQGSECSVWCLLRASYDSDRDQIMAMIQNGFAMGVKPGKCNQHCQKPGHWKHECPDLQRDQKPHKGWRTTPPAPGEPTTIQQPLHWCTKCHRWTLSHGTDSHVVGSDSDESKPAAQANTFIVSDPSDWEPSAWHTEFVRLTDPHACVADRVSSCTIRHIRPALVAGDAPRVTAHHWKHGRCGFDLQFGWLGWTPLCAE